jgi:hypothetical protein
MIESLDKTQQDVAVVDKTALKDIITGAPRKAALNGAPNGLSAAKMTAAQYDKLMTIVELYASNVPQAMAERRLEPPYPHYVRARVATSCRIIAPVPHDL